MVTLGNGVPSAGMASSYSVDGAYVVIANVDASVAAADGGGVDAVGVVPGDAVNGCGGGAVGGFGLEPRLYVIDRNGVEEDAEMEIGEGGEGGEGGEEDGDGNSDGSESTTNLLRYLTKYMTKIDSKRDAGI